MHPKLLDHFQNPRNAGTLPPPAVSVEAMNPVCGDVLRLWASVENGRIVRVSFQTRGCTASIAASSALTELIEGKGLDVLNSLIAADVEQALGELPAESGHAAVLCIDAIQLLSATIALETMK